MQASPIGTTIGNYRISQRIGGGGVGCVFRAEETRLGRAVAIKALRPEHARRPAMVERFRLEAKTLSRLSHPNITTLHTLLEQDDELFMVLEYVEGRTFTEHLRAEAPLSLDDCFDLFHQVLDGIAYAHGEGVIHRDLKPGNLMVDPRGLVKLMDFGIARVSGSERLTRVGGFVGTPEYMSPEQIRGEDANERSEIYALGILLFELLNGRPPFRSQGEFDVMRQQLDTEAPRLGESRPDLPADISDALARALAKDPADRFEHVEAFRAALVAAGAPARTESNLPTWVPPTQVDAEAPTRVSGAAPGPRRGPAWRWAAAASLVALALSANALHLEPTPSAVAPAERTPNVRAEPRATAKPEPVQAAVATLAPEREAPSATAEARPPNAASASRPRRQAVARPEPAAPEPDESGWVIRR